MWEVDPDVHTVLETLTKRWGLGVAIVSNFDERLVFTPHHSKSRCDSDLIVI